ncbi:MAG: TatD family hydrolase, partial [Sediminibacterium sp.]
NSREANNEKLAEQVMEILPLFVYKEGVVGIGEIGFDDQTPAEDKYYRLQLELAKEASLPVQVHTPHRDKKNGTRRSMDIAIEHGLDPYMVIVDHNNEETVKEVLDRGFWAAFTIYPFTKMGNERMVEMVKQYGTERIIVNSAADWGISDPLAVPKTAALMKLQGISAADIELVTYKNAITAFGQSGQINEEDFSSVKGVDQSQKFEGNTILRGGQQPRIDKSSIFIR